MANVNCPTLRHIKQEDQCEENFAGLGAIGYIFVKGDLNAALDDGSGKKITKVYSFPEKSAKPFKEGKGFFRIDLLPGSQSITGESQSKNGGYKQTAQLIIKAVNEEVSELCRALNNLDWALILPDGDKWQCMYLHNTQKITLNAGAIKTETGAQASDSRQTTIAPVLENCYFPNTWIQFAEGEGPEDFLAE